MAAQSERNVQPAERGLKSSGGVCAKQLVLVLEDDRELADVLKEVLEAEGLNVTVVSSGVQALVELARSAYQLALLDLDVPDLSGLGVQRAVSDVSSVETVVMSGRTGPWKREALEVGATACLSKPFDMSDLLQLVERLIGKEDGGCPWPCDVRQLSEADLRRVQSLSPTELDALPFGAIKVDGSGVIVAYNRYECVSVGRTAAAVIGMRLRDLAPCLMVKEFLDAVADGYRARHLDKVLRFVFPLHNGWRAVNLRLYFDAPHDSVWVFVAQCRRR